MAHTFGVETDSPGTYGFIQNLELDDTAEIASYRDPDGDTLNYKAHDRQETFSGTYVWNDVAVPIAGSTFTINANVYVCESAKIIETNDDFKRAEVSGRRWVTNTIPA